MQPTREQIEELQRALLSAVDLDQLRMIVRFSFNKELDHFVPTAGRNLTKIVRSTLDWAGAQEGGFLGLAESALAEHPDNPELREFVSCYAGSTFDPLPEPKESDEKSSENLEHELHKPFRRNPTFVGRRHELRQLTSALKKDAFVALRGAPGIGKSTLALEVADHVAPDFERVFWYSFSSPCDAGNLVYQLASFLACYGRDALWRRLRTLGSDADSQVSRHFQMALTLLKQGGFVLFLEDLHNAQENELIQSMLAQLIARRFDLDIKLLITSRSKLDPKLPKRALLLGGLDQRDVQQYLKKQLKRIRLSSEHVQLLHAYTAGNPQFVALAAAAIEQGADPEELLSRLARPGENIFAYLMQEVSDRLTLEQNLVMKAAAAHLGDPVTLEEINATAGQGANYVAALNSLLSCTSPLAVNSRSSALTVARAR